MMTKQELINIIKKENLESYDIRSYDDNKVSIEINFKSKNKYPQMKLGVFNDK